jgi:hypothetical protein
MTKLVRELVRPYHAWLIVVIVAMLVETVMSMAGPWPLKVVIDNVLGHHPLPGWLHSIRDLPLAQSKMGLASLAAISVILIAVIGGVATYIDNYYTERRTVGRTTCGSDCSTTCNACRSATTRSNRPACCCRRLPTMSRRCRTSRPPPPSGFSPIC